MMDDFYHNQMIGHCICAIKVFKRLAGGLFLSYAEKGIILIVSIILLLWILILNTYNGCRSNQSCMGLHGI